MKVRGEGNAVPATRGLRGATVQIANFVQRHNRFCQIRERGA